MATSVLVPVSEYLNTTYRPDCDYVDGEVRQRNMGEKPHGLLQGILFSIFQANRRQLGLLPLLEQRVQTSSSHFRIPDLCLVRPSDSSDAIVQVAPVLCVEILSRDDTLANMQERVDDYVAMGGESHLANRSDPAAGLLSFGKGLRASCGSLIRSRPFRGDWTWVNLRRTR